MRRSSLRIQDIPAYTVLPARRVEVSGYAHDLPREQRVGLCPDSVGPLGPGQIRVGLLAMTRGRSGSACWR